MASDTQFYSTYIHAQNTDLEDFKDATDAIGDHLSKKAGETARRAA